MQEIESFRDWYPVTDSKVWLNHASMGTLSIPVVDAVTGHMREHLRGDFTVESAEEKVQRARQDVAAFIGATADEIAFTKNVPDGLNIIASGIRWRRRDKVVTSDQEFPANMLPWLNLAKRGVETVVIPSVEGRVPLDRLIAALDDRTRMVALSWVEFSTGFRNDLATIARECKDRGIIFCVDGIQGIGGMEFNVEKYDVDIFVTSSHKWLLGPTGVGWMYCRGDLLEELDVEFVGQSSVQRVGSENFLDYTLPLWKTARKFEPGIHNQSGLVGLQAALDVFKKVGPSAIESRIKDLTNQAVVGLVDRGYQVISPRAEGAWSGIVSFRHPDRTSKSIHQTFDAAGVVVSLREPVVRISPHFYNNESDIERFLQALP